MTSPKIYAVLGRICLYLLLYHFILIALSVLLLAYDKLAETQGYDVWPDVLMSRFATLGSVLFTTWIFRKYADNESFFSLGLSLKGRGRDIIRGLLQAVLVIGGGFGCILLTGELKIAGFQWDWRIVGENVVLFAVVSFTEELMCRGYILNNLLKSMNKFAALALSSLFFALLHLWNSHLSWIGMLNLFLAGMLLGSTYIYTRNLWTAFSLHFFWNYFQGPVLGFNVSGTQTDSLLRLEYFSHTLYNGGAFGYEGSVWCTLFTFIALVGVLRVSDKEQRMLFSK